MNLLKNSSRCQGTIKHENFYNLCSQLSTIASKREPYHMNPMTMNEFSLKHHLQKHMQTLPRMEKDIPDHWQCHGNCWYLRFRPKGTPDSRDGGECFAPLNAKAKILRTLFWSPREHVWISWKNDPRCQVIFTKKNVYNLCSQFRQLVQSACPTIWILWLWMNFRLNTICRNICKRFLEWRKTSLITSNVMEIVDIRDFARRAFETPEMKKSTSHHCYSS